jgi:O-antigen/teichoic acid export membrane protein
MESVPEVRDYPERSQPAAAGGRVRALLNGRGVWALADQAMLSLGNFFTNILLGRNLPRDEFGNFVVLLSVIQFLNNLHWSLVTYPLSVISAGDDEDGLRHRAIRSLGLTLLLFIPFGLILGLAVAHVSGLHLIPWALLALLFWQIQETLRRTLMARLHHHRAIFGDAVSYIGQAITVWFIIFSRHLSVEHAFAIIAITSAIAALIQAIQLKLFAPTPRPAVSTPLFTENWALGKWVLYSNLISLLTVYATPWILWIHGAGEAAAYAALSTLLGVTNPILSGMSNLIVPAVAKANTERGLHAAKRAAANYGMQGAALLLPYYILLFAFPGLILRFFYSKSSPYLTLTTPLRLFVIIYAMFYVAQMLAGLFNGLGKSRWTFYAQLSAAISNSLIALPLAATIGLLGALAGGVVPLVLQLGLGIYFLGMLSHKKNTLADLNSPIPRGLPEGAS